MERDLDFGEISAVKAYQLCRGGDLVLCVQLPDGAWYEVGRTKPDNPSLVYRVMARAPFDYSKPAATVSLQGGDDAQ